MSFFKYFPLQCVALYHMTMFLHKKIQFLFFKGGNNCSLILVGTPSMWRPFDTSFKAPPTIWCPVTKSSILKTYKLQLHIQFIFKVSRFCCKIKAGIRRKCYPKLFINFRLQDTKYVVLMKITKCIHSVLLLKNKIPQENKTFVYNCIILRKIRFTATFKRNVV